MGKNIKKDHDLESELSAQYLDKQSYQTEKIEWD